MESIDNHSIGSDYSDESLDDESVHEMDRKERRLSQYVQTTLTNVRHSGPIPYSNTIHTSTNVCVLIAEFENFVMVNRFIEK